MTLCVGSVTLMFREIVLAAIDRDIFVGIGLIVGGSVFCLGRKWIAGAIYTSRVRWDPRYPYSYKDVVNGPLVMGLALLAGGVAVLVNVAVRHW